jgi:hypothetical protein
MTKKKRSQAESDSLPTSPSGKLLDHASRYGRTGAPGGGIYRELGARYAELEGIEQALAGYTGAPDEAVPASAQGDAPGLDPQAALSHVPADKRALLHQLLGQLRPIPGMAAIALGGSYASGTQHGSSDLDIGLYYHEDHPFDLAAIRQVAESVTAGDAPTVTGLYEWGPWVNGGAWIHTAPGKVDLLYRNLQQVQRTIAEAQAGISRHDYDQQPAYGFYSVIYLAETHICIPLYDPDGIIAALKRQVATYPPALKERVIADSLWSAEFTLIHARAFAAHGDIYGTVGCLTRVAANLTQALFALNEVYFIRDKQVMTTLATFPLLPAGYVEQVTRILACPGSTATELAQSVRDIERVWRSVTELPGVRYAPQFQV